MGWGDAPPPRGQQDLVVVLLLGVGAVQEQDVGVCLAAVSPHVVQKKMPRCVTSLFNRSFVLCGSGDS